MENFKIVGDDELYHFKYIKRYKKNGKWRYVYADRATHDKIVDLSMQSKLANRESARARIDAAESDREAREAITEHYYDSWRIWTDDASSARKRADTYLRESQLTARAANRLIESNSVSTKAKKFVDKIVKRFKK